MTLQEFFGVLENSDRIRIIKDGEDVFTGYLAMFKSLGHKLMTEKERTWFEQCKDVTVKKFSAVPEIRHKRWKELKLMRPLEPDETPDFSFCDLQMTLYYTIHI